MDRRAFVGAAAVGGVAAAVLAASSAVATGQSGYFVIAEIVSKKDKADDLRALLVPFAELSAKEPGCLVYTLMEVIGEPGRFLTFERWTDKAALGVHMTTPHIKEIVPKLEPVLANRSLSFSSTRARAAKQRALIRIERGSLLLERPGTMLDR
jgi:quinol monooxygenase YgiN